tara:strand:+ start:283 stop:774 length:492 start_codon:yes stop_codon:yes gene_type:complete
LTGSLNLKKELIILKETTKEVGKQLLEIFRLIVFIPAGFLAGTIISFPLILIARINQSMWGMQMDSWGTHLWQTLIIYSGVFVSSAAVRPKFLASKFFLFAWSVVLTLMATIFIKSALMPYDPEFPRIKEIINAFAPIGVFIFLIIDDRNDVLMLNKKTSPKE